MVVRPLLAGLLDPGTWEEADSVILAGVGPAQLGQWGVVVWRSRGHRGDHQVRREAGLRIHVVSQDHRPLVLQDQTQLRYDTCPSLHIEWLPLAYSQDP